MIIPRPTNSIYQKTAGLLALLPYAIAHQHSRAWVHAILNILARREVPRG
jgi:hypothetical protein